MQYSPFPPVPLIVAGSVIERVVPYKLLGVYSSEDLSWNVHIEHIVKKATSVCSTLRTLRNSGLAIMQLVQVYFKNLVLSNELIKVELPPWKI